MILQTVVCDVKGCGHRATETAENGGWPGWGHVSGLVDDKSGRLVCHLCPSCMRKLVPILNGEDKR